MIHFEHPLSERVRGFLRIEYLFDRFQAEITRQSEQSWAHHLALFTLFEIMECVGRVELKTDILQELGRQLSVAKTQNQIQKAVLEQLRVAAENLQNIRQKFGQHLRENDWLMAIKQRMFVAGGTSSFDLPSYYCWQQFPYERRLADLQQWSLALQPIKEAVNILLGILRQNTVVIDCVAQTGSYQSSNLAHNIHMLTIEVELDRQVFPEISANKYMTNIRFLEASQECARGKPVTYAVPFKLYMCSFDTQSI